MTPLVNTRQIIVNYTQSDAITSTNPNTIQ